MSSTITLRPISTDEHPWVERHAGLLNWGAFFAVLAAAVMFTPINSLGWDHYLWSIGLVGPWALIYGFGRSRRRTDEQLQELIVSKMAITLKRSTFGPAQEQVIWSLRRYEIGTVLPVVAGGSSYFALHRVTESKFWRFIQWIGVANGQNLRAFNWVNDARTDPQNRPTKLSDFSMRSRKRVIADMWTSDLGQALIAAGYGSAQAKGR